MHLGNIYLILMDGRILRDSMDMLSWRNNKLLFVIIEVIPIDMAKTSEVIVMEKLCPRFEKAMGILSTRWVGLILFELLDGTKRFSEVEASLPISGRLLSDRLKLLEKEGIVVRKVYSEFPVRIEYCLSEKGRRLEPVIRAIQTWAEENIPPEDKERQAK